MRHGGNGKVKVALYENSDNRGEAGEEGRAETWRRGKPALAVLLCNSPSSAATRPRYPESLTLLAHKLQSATGLTI